jgi:hypothetical protein
LKNSTNAIPNRDQEALNETYRDIDRIIGDLVECYALPHTKMCMRWSKPTVEEYREEVVGWLEDYSKSFRRLPEKSMPGHVDLRTHARKRLDEEVARIFGGKNEAVESSYRHLFD